MRYLQAFLVTCALLCGTLTVVGAPEATGAVRADVLGTAPDLVTWSPGHYTPPAGPKFNNPLGGQSARRTILRHVIRTVDSVRGYRLPKGVSCPRRPELYPAEIKISLYSIADLKFVDRLIAAHRRCISVQVLMNDHLSAATSPSWARLVHALGGDRSRRSFAYRCHRGCRGGPSVLHTKMYLFSQAGHARNVVMEGSSNMTSNAARVQWNDLLTAPDQQSLYDHYKSVFEEMVRDRRVSHPLRTFDDGRYQSIFFPQPNTWAGHDARMDMLRSIHCRGARDGAGSGGRTVVEINMHAWTGTRGAYLARKVHRMWAEGCIVRVLYGFMWHSTYTTLVHGTGPRMQVRRTIFPHPGSRVAAIYTHMKTIAVSGNVGQDPSSWVVWNGSDNFTNLGPRDDEVIMRTYGRTLYQRYVAHNAYIRRVKSSGTWAIYEEPSGGGRAPDAEARTAVGGTTTLSPSYPSSPGAADPSPDQDFD